MTLVNTLLLIVQSSDHTCLRRKHVECGIHHESRKNRVQPMHTAHLTVLISGRGRVDGLRNCTLWLGRELRRCSGEAKVPSCDCSVDRTNEGRLIEEGKVAGRETSTVSSSSSCIAASRRVTSNACNTEEPSLSTRTIQHSKFKIAASLDSLMKTLC